MKVVVDAVLPAQDRAEGNVLGGDRPAENTQGERTKHNSIAPSDCSSRLTCHVVAEAKTRRQVHPAVRIVGIVDIAQWPEMKPVVEQAVEIVNAKILPLGRMGNVLRVKIIAQPQVEREPSGGSPSVLHKGPE